MADAFTDSELEGSAATAVETPAATPKLKILYHHRTASKDGQAVHIEELLAAFRRQGHEVVVVEPPITKDLAFGGEKRSVRALKRYLPRAAFEVLEAGYSLLAYRRLARAYRAHRPDVLYERFNLYLLAGVWMRKRYGIPLFLEVNAPLFEERVASGGIALKRFAAWCQRAAWRGATMVLPVTDVLAADVKRAGVPEAKVAVVPNGGNPNLVLKDVGTADVRAARGLDGSIVLGFTGFIRDWHGLESVIDYLAEADGDPPLKLLVVGEGPGLGTLSRSADRRGVRDKVVFAGLVERAAIPAYISAFDVALQPAVTPYASPLKLFEYMALGRAIVAPRQPNIQEVLSDGENALLFTPGNQDDFRRQVARLCRDGALRERLGAAARRTVIERDFTWDGNARRLSVMFAEACRQEQARSG